MITSTANPEPSWCQQVVNLRCHQWRLSWHQDNSRLSVSAELSPSWPSDTWVNTKRNADLVLVTHGLIWTLTFDLVPIALTACRLILWSLLLGWLWGHSNQALIVQGIILDKGSANERRGYIVSSSLVGWAHTHDDPCYGIRKNQRQDVCAQQNRARHPGGYYWDYLSWCPSLSHYNPFKVRATVDFIYAWRRCEREAFSWFRPFVGGIHRSPADSPHKGPVRPLRRIFDVIMLF